MCANRLIVAAAGSGKTRLIVNEVIENPKKRILITTFTLANEQSIRQRLIRANKGVIPANVTVQPWFSFLIEHGVRPYRFWDKRVDGLLLVTQASGLRYKMKNGTPVYWSESDNFYEHYFSDSMNVYSDKLSKLVVKCNDNSSGSVIKRLEKLFDLIYIDEVQDMAGYDLEIIKLFLKSQIRITMVGDPRQTVYLTHHERKYGKYSEGKILEFIKAECKSICEIDEELLKNSHRNSVAICALSSKLYPGYSECISSSDKTHSHTGIFFVRQSDVKKYGEAYKPLQLRLRNEKGKEPLLDTRIMNFGVSKGLEADHVFIYPTADMLEWLNGSKVEFEFKTKAQLYVALTRAFFSIGILVDDTFKKKTNEIQIWNPND